MPAFYKNCTQATVKNFMLIFLIYNMYGISTLNLKSILTSKIRLSQYKKNI